ncbi:MAG TPA: sigma-54 dependent transcriptional regulator [Clostridia bacterium]|nr:sigma-54 dependent transcriptional regulator [Clostridia bacterium]
MPRRTDAFGAGVPSRSIDTPLPDTPPASTGVSDNAIGALTPDAVLGSFVASDASSLRLLEQIRRVAAAASTVLVRGESGSGKDLVASLLHYLGTNANEPLLKIDCASLPQELLESELFGFEKGAFTGATQMKRGRLESAGAGTIILDEIGALTISMQAKLLRAIEEKRFDRLGGHRPIAFHARIIALTSIDLESAVARRTFREDLYYRLNVIPLVIAPLRERPADIAPLAQHFLLKLATMHRKPHHCFAPEAISALEEYSFPGNVRELRNIVERGIIMSTSPEIGPEDLPAYVRRGSSTSSSKLTLEELERGYIEEILDHTRGKKSKAAAILGISRKTLLEKRKKYGLR